MFLTRFECSLFSSLVSSVVLGDVMQSGVRQKSAMYKSARIAIVDNEVSVTKVIIFKINVHSSLVSGVVCIDARFECSLHRHSFIV